MLSPEQQVLVAQLIKKQGQPDECYLLIKQNAKTRAFGQLFEQQRFVVVKNDTVELTPALFVQAHMNGITDDAGLLTEEGESMAQQIIEETFKFFRTLISA